MSITLSHKDTYTLLFNDNKQSVLKRRLKYRTYHKWWCLNCKCEIFVKYDIIGLPNIFCKDEDCQAHKRKPTIIQHQYLKRLKEEQLKLFENIK